MNKMQFRIILSFCLKNHGRRQRCGRSGVSADRRKWKPKKKMARSAETPLRNHFSAMTRTGTVMVPRCHEPALEI
jgi:hypothetical protein